MPDSSRRFRRWLALLSVFVAAKLTVLTFALFGGGGRAWASAWAPFAFLYQDALLLLAFAALDALLVALCPPRRRRITHGALDALCAGLAIYAAFNVAVARVMGTPLTIAMLGATGGALSDSIFGYFTWSNLLAVAGVLALGVTFAWRARLAPSPRHWLVLAGAHAALAVLGVSAAHRVETLGLHRNATFTLLSTWAARWPAPERLPASVPPLPREGQARDLTHFEGAVRGRNVVWVILESTAAEYLGIYGASPDPTPTLTRLARHGVVFESAYAAYPASIKGLASMLCSVHPAAHTDADAYSAQRLPCASIAQRLKSAGYRTGLFHSGRFRYLGMQGVVDDRGFDELHDAGTIGGKYASSFGTDDASTAERLLGFVDEGEGPFFAVYSPIAGHHPYRSPGNGPRPFPQSNDREAYLNDLYAGDAALARIVDGLVARKLYDKTLFVIVGDHGEAFGKHEGNFAHTLALYEENVRVPFVLSAPGVMNEQLRAPQIASLVDMAPTTLALLGLSGAASHQGRSLLTPEPGIARFFTDHGPLKLGLRHGPYKLIYESEHDRTRLFRVDVDPDERHDLAGEQPERAARYREHLSAFSRAQRARIAGHVPAAAAAGSSSVLARSDPDPH